MPISHQKLLKSPKFCIKILQTGNEALGQRRRPDDLIDVSVDVQNLEPAKFAIKRIFG